MRECSAIPSGWYSVEPPGLPFDRNEAHEVALKRDIPVRSQKHPVHCIPGQPVVVSILAPSVYATYRSVGRASQVIVL